MSSVGGSGFVPPVFTSRVVESRKVGIEGGFRPLDGEQKGYQQDLERALEAAGVPRTEDGFAPYPDPFKGQWVNLVNDGGRVKPGRFNNCADAGLALLSTWYGKPLLAAARTDDMVLMSDGTKRPSLRAEHNSTGRQETVLGAPFFRHKSKTSVIAEITTELTTAGHGSAALLSTTHTYNGQPVSHTTTVVNHHGTIIWIDPQNRTVTTTPPDTDHLTAAGTITLDPHGKPLHPTTTNTTATTPQSATTTTPPARHRHRTDRPAGHQPPATATVTVGADRATTGRVGRVTRRARGVVVGGGVA